MNNWFLLLTFLCSSHHRMAAHPAINHRQDHPRIRNQHPERVASYIIDRQAAGQQKRCCQKLSAKELCLLLQFCRRKRRLIPRPDVFIAVPAFLIIFSVIPHAYSFPEAHIRSQSHNHYHETLLLPASSAISVCFYSSAAVFSNTLPFLFLTNSVSARIVTFKL